MSGNGIYLFVIAIAALVLWRRTRSMYRPIRGSGIRLLLPLLALLPGLTLIFNPQVSEPAWAYGIAFGLGMVLSIPLIWTTNYEVRADNFIYARKNWGFVVAFVGVVVIRLALRHELTNLEPQAKIALFMTVLCGYLIPWRIVSFIKFRRVLNNAAGSDTALS
ncbi:DUF1453 family protein [bacterium]|nr:DUF1453 family protein [bacterium]